MKKTKIAALAAVSVLTVVSGCVNRDGLVAKNVAMELMENGSYSAAAEQCAIAIGNGVNDKEFVHISDVINAYNSALSEFESGNISGAAEKISDIHEYSDLAMAKDIEELKEKIDDANSFSISVDDTLNEVKRLYDSGDYKAAQKKLYSISEADMDANQQKNFDTFEINIENKLNAENNTSSAPTVKHAGSSYNYSAYDNSLSQAYVSGAETGSVYFWVASSGDSYTATLSNGTSIYTTGHSSGGRTLVKWNGSYGWITSRYISSGYSRYSYNSVDHYIRGASTGSVYVWKSAYGDAYYTTITNGTYVTPTGYSSNGRSEIYWGNGYAWITSAYLY